MKNAAKVKARNQLIFSVLLLIVAVTGYLATESYGEKLAQQKSPEELHSDPAIPKPVTVEGSYVCLPHKDADGPQTTECAFGLRADDGRYYGLDLSATNQLNDAPTESRVQVVGTLVPVEALSADRWQVYDIVGVIGASRVEKL
jgi:hypothetical protein